MVQILNYANGILVYFLEYSDNFENDNVNKKSSKYLFSTIQSTTYFMYKVLSSI